MTQKQLSKAQRQLLARAIVFGAVWTLNKYGNTAMSLCRLGYLTRLGTGAYLIAEAGRQALSQEPIK